jgi:hypothetical protein
MKSEIDGGPLPSVVETGAFRNITKTSSVPLGDGLVEDAGIEFIFPPKKIIIIFSVYVGKESFSSTCWVGSPHPRQQLQIQGLR